MTEFKVGERVIAGCGNGGMSEAVAVSVHNVSHLPESHGFAEGASLLMTYGTSIHALVDRGPEPPVLGLQIDEIHGGPTGGVRQFTR